MTHIVGPLHKLMEGASSPAATNKLPFQSVGVGDGGNEVGMGKMFNEIQQSTVNHKEKVCMCSGFMLYSLTITDLGYICFFAKNTHTHIYTFPVCSWGEKGRLCCSSRSLDCLWRYLSVFIHYSSKFFSNYISLYIYIYACDISL